MGKPTGFMEFRRQGFERRPVSDRLKDFSEFSLRWAETVSREQGARCMGCAVPFCQQGCPLGNLIPDWNDLVYKGRWEEALAALHATNNFPEFTGRVCPAPCEASCVLAINTEPTAIEYIEKTISDRGFDSGWIKPQPPEVRTGKRVAVVGSGPAGLAAAQQLNRADHLVTVFERSEFVGGLLSLGIPAFKLSKEVVQRRVDLLAAEGIEFRTGVDVGHDIQIDQLRSEFDAVCLTGGSTIARPLTIPGAELAGVHFAMEFLSQQNRVDAGQVVAAGERITAEGKNVLILGGGDTGSDCLGTAHRQGAKHVIQCEILAEPPMERSSNNPWPLWPIIFRSSHAHEEGGERQYSILTKGFSGANGQVQAVHCARLEWITPEGGGRPVMHEIPGSDFDFQVDLVVLALGFLHPQHEGMLADLGVALDSRGNVVTDGNKMTSVDGVFAAGDMARGQSLVVWAIAEGRQAANGIDTYLTGKESMLPRLILRAF